MQKERWLPPVLTVFLALPLAVQAQVPAPAQRQPIASLPAVQSLCVIPLAGEGEMNDMERGIMAPLVVQVLDQNSRPVEGAEVVFRFPLNGPSAVFPDQKNSQTMKTNADGQAAAVGWKANGQAGSFQVRITASRGNELGESTVTMTNVARIVAEAKRQRKRWWSSKWFKIGIVAGAATAAILVATRGGTDSATTITISPGSPTIGGPQ